MATNPTSAAYFARSEPYLRGNHRISLRLEIVRELIGSPRGKRIIDLGCGNGAISLPFANDNSITLVDNSAAMLDAAKRLAESLGIDRYSAIQADACGISVEPADIVLAIGVLAHVDDSSKVLRAIARNLRPDGLAVLQFSDSSRFFNRIGNKLFRLRGRRYRETSRDEVMQAIAASGLRVVDEKSHLLILPGIPRLVGRAIVPYDRFVRRHSRLAEHGLDTLMLLAKDDELS